MSTAAAIDRRRKWFAWGLTLTGISSIPLLVGLAGAVRSVRDVADQKATGLGAVAGGLVEVYSIFGLILSVLLPVAAIILLAKSFADGKRVRSFVAIASICFSSLLLAIPFWTMWVLLQNQVNQ